MVNDNDESIKERSAERLFGTEMSGLAKLMTLASGSAPTSIETPPPRLSTPDSLPSSSSDGCSRGTTPSSRRRTLRYRICERHFQRRKASLKSGEEFGRRRSRRR